MTSPHEARAAQKSLSRRSAIVLGVPFLLMAPRTAAAEPTPEQALHAAAATPQPQGWGVTGYPIIFYSPETKTALGGGLALYRPRPSLRPDVTELEVFGTQMRQLELNLKNTTFLSGNDYELFGELRLNRSPGMAFFGLGANSAEEGREEYLDRSIIVAPRFTVQVAKNLFLGPAVRVAAYSAGQLPKGGLLAQGTLPGGQEALAVGAGLATRLDTTNSSFYPTRGFRSEVTALLYRRAIGSDHDFAQVRLEHRHFVGFGNDHVLAFHALATFSTGTVPWQMVPRLGGMSMLRGYYEGRYRDHHYVAAQAEYRFPVYWRFASAFFVGAGEVASSLSQLASGPVRASAGGGLRILLDEQEHINLRADVAVTLAGSADFYIALMEAF